MIDRLGTVPDFVNAGRVAAHTIDSALQALVLLGVEPARVVVETIARGWPAGTVVSQDPPPGTPLTGQTRIRLVVSEHGGLESLPYPMRESHDTQFGSDRLMALFDDPLQKLAHFVRLGGGHFALDPADPLTARRWIEDIFQLDATRWAEQRWYAIARLLPMLHRLAGHEAGIRLALRVVFDLPLAALELRSAAAPAAAPAQARLGVLNSRLGVDAVAGSTTKSQQAVAVRLGPISLPVFRSATAPGEGAQRDALYALLLPLNLAGPVVEQWVVGDPAADVRLGGAGDDEAEAVLGVNTYLGSAPGRRVA
jgi:hypothetical protein